ncbi:MAG: 30S ribosome-binding factor RbfA [Bacteroidota bacterium]|nr:30S ribosome-binding factor RbfA [Bacteroidota bacterium]
MESTRQKKVARLLQKELAEILRQKTTELARGKMLTVTTVRVSPDLSLAKVYVSIFPSDDSIQTLDHIIDNTPRIRNELGNKVGKQLRIIPEIAFYLDDSLDYIDNIDSLLDKD